MVAPAGSTMFFNQANPPEGWQINGSVDNAALRLSSSAGGVTGGSIGFTSAFSNQTLNVSDAFWGGSTTTDSRPAQGSPNSSSISVSELYPHNHFKSIYSTGPPTNAEDGDRYLGNKGYNVGNSGSNGNHDHGITFPNHSHSLNDITGPASGSSSFNVTVTYCDMIMATKQ